MTVFCTDEDAPPLVPPALRTKVEERLAQIMRRLAEREGWPAWQTYHVFQEAPNQDDPLQARTIRCIARVNPHPALIDRHRREGTYWYRGFCWAGVS